MLHSGREVARLEVARDSGVVHLRLDKEPQGGGDPLRPVMAALEALFADDPSVTHAVLEGSAWAGMAEALTRRGLP